MSVSDKVDWTKLREPIEKKSFYNAYEALTKDGVKFLDEARAAIEPILFKYAEMGYSLREIQGLTHQVGDLLLSFAIVRRGIDKRQREEKK